MSVDAVSTGYHKKIVLDGVTFHVGEGERVAVVGRNGAGKSTLLQTLLGVLPAWGGQIVYLGSDVTHRPPQERVRSGMALVPQGGRVFANLTVRENLELGAYVVRDPGAVARARSLVYETFPRLGERAAQRAGTLSGGERQMLAIGRALMVRPKLLMLDEPSSGLAPIVVRELMEKIHGLSASLGTTILMVEQNVREAFKIVERVYVLKLGKIVLEEQPDVLLRDDRLRKAYLG
ncbi:MAG: ABC transporter ATP-binding protein [Candidatus Rokubacteria bacterium]|nr:ABC transporter ATP-binding protein [Candidatus Rokubacteria bacterium]